MLIITTGRMPDIRSAMAASASWLLLSAGGLGGQVWIPYRRPIRATPALPRFPCLTHRVSTLAVQSA